MPTILFLFLFLFLSFLGVAKILLVWGLLALEGAIA